ncbi:MAG: carboxypeptidase-like regulatory domain-containing protein, partial [Flavobacteriales bacterium]|nr:carboxypeptidase-like regulatory domain-containing protein [Flavobacteriales bacterium]
MKRLMMAFLGVCLSLTFLGQITIEGRVVDENQQPIPFANAFLVRSQQGVSCDIDGQFKLVIAQPRYSSDSLEVSFIGYSTFTQKVFLNKNTKVQATLKSESIELPSAEVLASKSKDYSASKIIKLALKNRKKNYTSGFHTSEAFYRETMLLNEQCIKNNEAAIQLLLSGYPQKRHYKGGFKKYWDVYYDSYQYLHKLGGFPRLAQMLPYYNSKHDQADVLSSRTSQQMGPFSYSINPTGGPMDLVGNDKLKYGYDFFDTKLIKDYIYVKDGYAEVNGETCYVIRFRPKEYLSRNYGHNFSKKMELALYTGKVLVSLKDFAVLEIDCSRLYLTQSNNMRYPTIFKPTNSNLRIKYERGSNGIVVLSEISNIQEFSFDNGSINQPFVVNRNIWINTETVEQLQELPEAQNPLELTTNSTVEAHTLSYASLFWNEYTHSSTFVPLPAVYIEDLESKVSLTQQYVANFTPVTSLQAPEYLKVEDYAPSVFGDSIVDYYRWLELPSDQTLSQIEQENEYYEQFMSRLKKYKKEYLGKYNSLLVPDTSSRKPTFLVQDITYEIRTFDDSVRLYQYSLNGKR